MKNFEKSKAEESEKNPDGLPASCNLPSPKRGAFPTPETEIENAKPYIPDIGQTDCPQPVEPDLPSDDDEEGK
jgi:hypothetical protein